MKMLTEYYVQYIYRDKPLESYSLTLIETAHECIRYYNEGKGAFLHLFNAVMKRAMRVAVAKEQTERYRQGIRLAREDSYAIRKIIAFAKNKRLDIYDTDCQRKISQVLCLDPERVAELITMNENATAISNRVQGEDDEIDLFDTVADRDISAEEKLIDRSEAIELLKIADAVFSGCQARQKRMISLALTSEVVKAFDEDVEMAEKIMEGFSFRSEEWFVYYRENRAIGDLVFGSVVEVTVKGIELIDKKIVKFGEKKINCTALCALKKKTFQNREGKTVTVPDYGTREVTDPVLTHDFVNQLCGELYPIPHPEQAIKMLEDWREYMIYFRPNGNMDRAADIEKEIEKCGSKYLIYDNRAEKAKIDRQEKALDSLACGYVRNPYLPTYLFAPELLAQSDKGAEKEPDWLLSSLNSGQKMAVRRALASESIFLLQGPPGTGKTQVIAELTAQFAKQGKKVLISSETHKAIDNVFERLPKIPEIRPLRLIPSQAGKENNFSPEKLVDNFYENIRSNLERQVDRFEHFEETKDSFDEEMKKLSAEYRRLLRLKRENAKTEAERDRLLSEISRGNIRLQQLREDRTAAREKTEAYLRTQKRIETCSIKKKDADALLLERFEGEVVDLLIQFSCLAETLDIRKVKDIYFADLKMIREEIERMLPEDEIGKLQAKQIQLRKELSALRDPDTDEAPAPRDARYEEYKAKQAELIALSKAIKQYDGEKVETDGFLYDVAPSIVGHRELLSVFMRPSGVEFSFETSDERAFFDKYYTADLITEGMSYKDSYRFVNEKGELLQVPEISVAAFEKVQNIYIPADYKKQAKRPCKLFLNGGMLEVDRNDVLQPDTKAAAEILKMLDPNAAFALIDSSGIRYYTAVRVSMPCVNFEGAFRLPLLLEYKADDVTANEVIKKLYERYTVMPFTRENGKVISFIAELMKDAKYLSYYAENKLAECASEDDKVSVLLELNKSFASSVGWQEYFKSEGEKIFSESAAGVAFDNVIYKNALLSPLGKALSLSSGQYIQKFSARLANTEERDLVFQALESAGFSVSEILGIANVAETYMQSVLANEPIESDTEFSAQFRVLQGNLWKLNQMLGITSVSDYTLKDDFNTDEFFDAYSTLSAVLKEIQQYQPFAPKEYANLLRYIEIYRPIHELLAAERASASHHEKITRKYIDDLIARGKYKEAICDLSVKLQYELRRILNEEQHATVNDMINEARDRKIIDRQQADTLHRLRKCRNGFQHPEAGEVKSNKEMVENWRDLVLQVAEN